MTCKNCETNEACKYSKYTSGEYCSRKCARAFTTKGKREEINRKVSQKLTIVKEDRICKYCLQLFTIRRNMFYDEKKNQFCSRSCSMRFNWSQNEYRDKVVLGRDYSKLKFTSHKCIFDFNGEQINCDSKTEHTILSLIVEKYEVLKVERCNFKIKYFMDDELSHHYTPDYKIVMVDGCYILECKTTLSKKITDKTTRPHYFLSIPFKKEALKKYCSEHGFGVLWYEGKHEKIKIVP